MASVRPLEVEVRPPWPYRLPSRLGMDAVARRRGGVVSRLLALGDERVVVHAWQPERARVRLRAVPADGHDLRSESLELAVERMRFALAVDDDLTEFARTFRGDPLIGTAIHHRPWLRPKRRAWPWEALVWAITEQLIEARRAGEIQRRAVYRWGGRLEPSEESAWRGPGPLRDVPSPGTVAGLAPAELAAIDLAPKRAVAMVKVAREVAAGRVDCNRAADDHRLLAITDIGPWTVQILGYSGRGDPDSLPAGDLAYVKLVGLLAGLGRRATVEEVEEYFAPYAPFRGLAGSFALARWHGAVAQGPPLGRAALGQAGAVGYGARR